MHHQKEKLEFKMSEELKEQQPDEQEVNTEAGKLYGEGTRGTFFGKTEKPELKQAVEAGLEKAEEKAEAQKTYNRQKEIIKTHERAIESLANENLLLKMQIEKQNFGLPASLSIFDAEALFRFFVAVVNGYGWRYRGFGGIRTIGKIFGAQTFEEEKKRWEIIKMFVFDKNREVPDAQGDGSSVEEAGKQEGKTEEAPA